MSKVKSIINKINRENLTIEEIEHIQWALNDKREMLISASPPKDRHQPFDEAMQKFVEEQIQEFEEKLNTLKQKNNWNNMISFIMDEFRNLLEANSKTYMDTNRFLVDTKNHNALWQKRHMDYRDEMIELIDQGFTSDVITIAFSAFGLAYIGLRGIAERDIEPGVEFHKDGDKQSVSGRYYDILHYASFTSQMTMFYQVFINVMDNLRLNREHPSFACWLIMNHLHKHDGTIPLEVIQQLNLEWMKEHIEESITHERLRVGLEIAHISYQSDMPIKYFVTRDESRGYGESYVKRMRQWYRKIEENRGNFAGFENPKG